MQSNANNTPLTDEEYEDLGALLAAPGHGAHAMDVSTLEGFLTAVVIGPVPLTQEQWLPLVWDKEDGARGLSGATAAELERAQGLVMRHYHHMVTWLSKDPASFEPIFACGPEWGAQQWSEGFLRGVRMGGEAWAFLQQSQPELFAPFKRLAGEGTALSLDDDEIEGWMDEVSPAIIKINAFYVEQRAPKRSVTRDAPKVGRNDPCPCGSGKKYKKCCGADA